MSRRKVNINCLSCNKEFESTLRWEGTPEKEYCSMICQQDFEEYEDEDNFEKFHRSDKEWI
jgi:hypothetical protein